MCFVRNSQRKFNRKCTMGNAIRGKTSYCQYYYLTKVLWVWQILRKIKKKEFPKQEFCDRGVICQRFVSQSSSTRLFMTDPSFLQCWKNDEWRYLWTKVYRNFQKRYFNNQQFESWSIFQETNDFNIETLKGEYI